MLESVAGLNRHISLTLDQLLINGEVVAIVDDDAGIRDPLKLYLEAKGLPVVEAGSAAEFRSLLGSRNIALTLLDIGLPDANGSSLLPELVNNYPEQAIIMLTGVADLQVAMECIRNGADDYLSKPVRFQEILFVVKKVLERRRLIFENQKYREDLEKAHFRANLLHQLSLKMNTVYLSTVELDAILHAILVGITAEEGLQFNRAFLALINEDGSLLEGKFAIGEHCREDAGRVWSDLKEKKMGLFEIIEDIASKDFSNGVCSKVIQAIRIPVADQEHLLIRAVAERRSILVSQGRADVPVSQELLELFDEDSFVVVPLFSPSRPLGVIITDNYVTRRPISEQMIKTLEVFAGQASLAIEHSFLYRGMERKIAELEELTLELDKNKDLLVQADRYSALGHMAAQLVHVIRNPVTSIGGAARILAKRLKEDEWQEFISMIVRETAKLESTVEDLFDFVSQEKATRQQIPLNQLVRKTVLLVQPAMTRQGVAIELELPEPEPVVGVDEQQIRQMLLHLLKNAVEAMPAGGRLKVAVQPEDDWISLVISDTGIGLGPENLGRASDPFFTTKTYGTGLGLTLVEKIVKSHAGQFFLKKQPGGGMEANVRLPR